MQDWKSRVESKTGGRRLMEKVACNGTKKEFQAESYPLWQEAVRCRFRLRMRSAVLFEDKKSCKN